MSNFFAAIPVWVYIVIILIVGIIIWSKLDFSTRQWLRNVFTVKVILFLGFVITWYFWARNGAEITLKNAHHWMPIIGLVILAFYNYLGFLRYKTRQIVCSNYHGSYNTDPVEVNGFLIFPIGSLNAGGISIKQADEILVVREETCEQFEDGAVSIARVAPVSIYELDDDVKEMIQRTGYLRTGARKVLYGWFDDIERIDWDFQKLKKLEKDKKQGSLYSMLKSELGVDNPSVKELYRLYRNAQKAKNKQVEVLDSVVEDKEKGAEHHKRMREVYNNPREEQQPKTDGYEEV